MLYGAVRSTGQIEEGGGRPGYAIVTLRHGVTSWRFKELGSPWPFVQIVAPADRRLVTRPADPRQVPRPGMIAIAARSFGSAGGLPRATVDGVATEAMSPQPDGTWSAIVMLDEGLHHVAVEDDGSRDEIEILVRPAGAIPKRLAPLALGTAAHSFGAWPSRGIDGARLGPNANGYRW